MELITKSNVFPVSIGTGLVLTGMGYKIGDAFNKPLLGGIIGILAGVGLGIYMQTLITKPITKAITEDKK